ncbi:hypothetical protein [Streptomyces sp. NPDC050759]|uniref:hypothetical protein n=1 Tax=Streptomyces sp. NPDC050759 TaxID=3365635 RepID=UPI003799204C
MKRFSMQPAQQSSSSGRLTSIEGTSWPATLSSICHKNSDNRRPEQNHVLARIVFAEANDQATVLGTAGLVISGNLRLMV